MKIRNKITGEIREISANELDQYGLGGMIKRADGSYSRRGLWDNIRANKGSGKKPTKEMLAQEKKIKAKYQGGTKTEEYEENPFDIPEYTVLPTLTVKASKIKKETSNKEDSLGEDIFELIDPTGLSSWDDVYRSYKETGLSPATALEVLGAIPLLGKIGKSGKIISGGFRMLQDIAPYLKNKKTQDAAFKIYNTYKNLGGGKLDDVLGYTSKLVKNNIKLLNPKLQGSSQKAIDFYNNFFRAIRATQTPQVLPTYPFSNEINIKDFISETKQDKKMQTGGKLPKNVLIPRLKSHMNQDEINKYLEQYASGGKIPTEILKSRLESHMSPEEVNNYLDKYGNGGYTVRRTNERKGKTHVVIGPDGTKKYFGDPNMGERGKSKYGKEAFYARHKSNLAKNPYFRAYARATWEQGGMMDDIYNMYDNYNSNNMSMGVYEDGGIHIKKENRGKFTEAANRADMSVQEYARHILANKEDYSSTMVKRANFARNAAKWKHETGGKFLTVSGEAHKIYKNADGDIMVNHPKENKGKWDTINLTEKANINTVVEGVAATKKWHKENPYALGGLTKYQTGGPAKPLVIYPESLNLGVVSENTSVAPITKLKTQGEQLRNINEQKTLKAEEKIKQERNINYVDKVKGLEVNRTDAPINLTDLKTKDDVKKIQTFLLNKGYDLGKYGVDGIAGKFTKNAINQYNNQFNNVDFKYYDLPSRKESRFGSNCAEGQCSEYTAMELYRRSESKASPDEFLKTLGLGSNAWQIGNVIKTQGGTELYNNKTAKSKTSNVNVKPGDITIMYTGGSSFYQDEANKKGDGNTHVGFVSKVNPDGSYYVTHNVHLPGGIDANGDVKWVGHAYEDLVNPKSKIVSNWGFKVNRIVRPDYNKIKKDIAKKDVNPDNKITYLGDRQKASNIISKINSNKKELAEFFKVEEEDHAALQQAALGIIEKESKFGEGYTGIKSLEKVPYVNDAAQLITETISETDKRLKSPSNLAKGKFLKINSEYGKDEEASKGLGRIKFEMNFGDNKQKLESLKKLSKGDSAYFDYLATFSILEKNYNDFLRSGYNKNEALYRAIAKHNSPSKAKDTSENSGAKNLDLDYANKVIDLSRSFIIKNKNNNVQTILDNLSLDPNLIKNTAKIPSIRNEKSKSSFEFGGKINLPKYQTAGLFSQQIDNTEGNINANTKNINTANPFTSIVNPGETKPLSVNVGLKNAKWDMGIMGSANVNKSGVYNPSAAVNVGYNVTPNQRLNFSANVNKNEATGKPNYGFKAGYTNQTKLGNINVGVNYNEVGGLSKYQGGTKTKIGNSDIYFDSDKSWKDKDGNLVVSDLATGKHYNVFRKSDGSYDFLDVEGNKERKFKSFLSDWNNSPQAKKMLLDSVKDDNSNKSQKEINKNSSLLRQFRNKFIDDTNVAFLNPESLLEEFNKNKDKKETETFDGFSQTPSSSERKMILNPNYLLNNPLSIISEEPKNLYNYINKYDPNSTKVPMRVRINNSLPKQQEKDTYIHELSHASDFNGFFIPGIDKTIIENNAYRNAENISDGDPEWLQNQLNESWYKYLTKPSETRARLNNLRFNLKEQGIYDPFKQEIKLKQLDKYKKTEKGDPLYELQTIYDDDQIIDMLNTISDVNKSQDFKAEVGGLKPDLVSQEGYKDDSPFVDNPFLDIMSNKITMKGVSQPILGISDQGDIKVMLPGEEYQFKGTKVKEMPVFQDGGLFNKKNNLNKFLKEIGIK